MSRWITLLYSSSCVQNSCQKWFRDWPTETLTQFPMHGASFKDSLRAPGA